MAQVLGLSGRYASQEAVRKRRKLWLITFTTSGAGFWISGFLIGGLLPWQRHRWVGLSLAVFCLVFTFFLCRWALRKMDSLESERLNWMRGTQGERLVAIKLDDLPEEYRVIHDLTTRFGNLDHVVVGPTGVFVLDDKNCRGVVESDGKGELLLNGKPTEKPYVQQLVGRMMGIRDKTMKLAEEIDPFPLFRALLVFTSARVDADWGTTGKVHCIRDEKLMHYITNEKFAIKLTKLEVDSVAQAFLALAYMDPDFSKKARTRE